MEKEKRRKKLDDGRIAPEDVINELMEGVDLKQDVNHDEAESKYINGVFLAESVFQYSPNLFFCSFRVDIIRWTRQYSFFRQARLTQILQTCSGEKIVHDYFLQLRKTKSSSREHQEKDQWFSFKLPLLSFFAPHSLEIVIFVSLGFLVVSRKCNTRRKWKVLW